MRRLLIAAMLLACGGGDGDEAQSRDCLIEVGIWEFALELESGSPDCPEQATARDTVTDPEALSCGGTEVCSVDYTTCSVSGITEETESTIELDVTFTSATFGSGSMDIYARGNDNECHYRLETRKL